MQADGINTKVVSEECKCIHKAQEIIETKQCESKNKTFNHYVEFTERTCLISLRSVNISWDTLKICEFRKIRWNSANSLKVVKINCSKDTKILSDTS